MLSDPTDWYAARLKAAFKGFGTSDRPVCRIIGAHDKREAAAIAAAFEAKYGQPLAEAVTAECSGNYKRLLIAWFATADALEQPGEPVELPPPMEAEEEQPEPPPMPPPPPEEEEEEEEDPNSLEAVAARLGIDGAELEKLREKFDRFDADGSGAIDAAEVRARAASRGWWFFSAGSRRGDLQ